MNKPASEPVDVEAIRKMNQDKWHSRMKLLILGIIVLLFFLFSEVFSR